MELVQDTQEEQPLPKMGWMVSLTLQCEYACQEGHQYDDDCGTLIAKGNVVHAGAIGSTMTNVRQLLKQGFVILGPRRKS